MTNHPMFVEPRMAEDGNLSIRWAESFCRAMDPGLKAFTPLVVSITNFGDDGLPVEDPDIRAALEEAMGEFGKGLSVETVAGTIFPHTFWRPGVPRDRLFARYKSIVPRLRRDARNRNGLYFERLTAFAGAPEDGNQLEFILHCYRQHVRRKPALQATVFDPAVDLPGQAAVFDSSKDLTLQPQRGFPCMQQVAFAPDSERGTVAMSAFYASQYLFKRAYGNYLGLCRLGRFMAHEMGLRLERMTCYVGYAHLDDSPSKANLRTLETRLRGILDRAGSASVGQRPLASGSPVVARRRAPSTGHQA
jgi:hypothetical protein